MGRLRACGDCGKRYPMLFGHHRQCTQRKVEIGILLGLMVVAVVALVVATDSPLSFTDDFLAPALAGLVGCAIVVAGLRVFGKKSAG
jgi:hypothetical protein